MREADLQRAVRLALGTEPGLVLFRNNVGVAKYGRETVRYGLAPGSSDLIGICSSRFIALEIKTDRGRVTTDQTKFIELVRKLGGFACIVRSVEDAKAAVARCRAGACE